MRIVIDPQGALGASRIRGIGRYTRSFLPAFAKVAQHHEIFVVVNSMLPAAVSALRRDLDGLVPPQNFIAWSAESPIGGMYEENAQRRAFAKEIWEGVVESLDPDLLILTSLFEGADDDAVCSVPAGRNYLVATIFYDLIPLIYNQHYLMDQGMRTHYRRQAEALANSDFLLSISQSAADEVAQLLRYPAERVTNISASVEPLVGDVAHLPLDQRFNITRPYLLYVSGFDVRKNHAGLIKAYAMLPGDVRNSHQLVLGGDVGDPAPLRALAEQQGLAEDEVIFTDYIDDQELSALYKQAKAVVFPSWHEGFGLPILEAMSFGKAVISSNRSSMPEVVGNDAALFDPHDLGSIAKSVERVLTDTDFRHSLEKNAPSRVASFTWERSAKLALSFLEERIARFPRPRDYQRRYVANTLGRIRSNPALSKFPTSIASDHIARSFRRDERRQLLIDVSRLVVEDARTGIQRVVRAILVSLLKNPPTGWIVQPVYANTEELGYRYARQLADRCLGLEHPWHSDSPVEIWSGDVMCALDLELEVLMKQRPVLDEWRRRGVEVYTVVYDILPLLMPDNFPGTLGTDLFPKWICELARHDGAIAISHTVANQLEQWMLDNQVEHSTEFRFGWFHQGSDIANSNPVLGLPSSSSGVLAMLQAKPNALMVGTVEPRKGHAQTVDAFELLWEQGVDIALVIVGKPGWHIESLAKRITHHPEYGKRLIWLQGISDEFLERIYESATVLLAASIGEGFGLPLIEAASKKVPLIVRDIPIFREVAGDAAFYFADQRDPAAIANGIKIWLDLHRQGKHPKPDSMRTLSWAQSAEMLVQQLIGVGTTKR